MRLEYRSIITQVARLKRHSDQENTQIMFSSRDITTEAYRQDGDYKSRET